MEEDFKRIHQYSQVQTLLMFLLVRVLQTSVKSHCQVLMQNLYLCKMHFLEYKTEPNQEEVLLTFSLLSYNLEEIAAIMEDILSHLMSRVMGMLMQAWGILNLL